MVEQLFGSKTRVKLLQLFFSNPNRSFYVREITRKIDEQINSVRRELANLLSIGIISSDNNNNRLYYEVNQQYDYYKALAAIFGRGGAKMLTQVGKEVSAPEDTDEIAALKKVGNVELAILTGQFTRDESSGIDMLVVGDINQTKMNKYISEMEAKEGKEIRFVIMDDKEYDYREQVKDRFLVKLAAAKKQILIDKKHRFDN